MVVIMLLIVASFAVASAIVTYTFTFTFILTLIFMFISSRGHYYADRARLLLRRFANRSRGGCRSAWLVKAQCSTEDPKRDLANVGT